MDKASTDTLGRGDWASDVPLTGCGTALVTPFQADGSIDERRVVALARRQVAAGVHFLVPLGTTGEGVTMSRAEKVRVAELVVEAAAGDVPVVAGCGGNDTREVVALARDLSGTGSDALLTVTPFYNKPTPEGLYRHYAAVAEATDLPIIVYNVPGRTGVNVAPSTLARLATIPGIVGVKEASGDIAQIGRVCAEAQDGFSVLAGDDTSALPTIALGGHGVISVVANEIPGQMAELCDHCLSGDFQAARHVHRHWLPLMAVNFIEANPGPVKFAMSEMGLLDPFYRLPMTEITAENREQVLAVMGATGLS